MKKNPLRELLDAGQSYWMDTISRQMIQDGTLKRLIREDGLRGVTSNPDIFQKAISGSNLYDAQIKKLALAGKNAAEIYEALAVDDIQQAADILRPVYDESKTVDGLISLEVSPYLGFDTKGTIEEARRLWKSVNRPNVFIKVPATPPGIPAIRTLISEGINVNITLIFSLEAYGEVMNAYIGGLEDRVRAGKPIRNITSVASFFVSRIDVLVDKLLGNRIIADTPISKGKTSPQELLGKAAIANAKIAYQNYKRTFFSKRFAKLRAKGAKVQRPLWASTSTKNPLYKDTLYVDPLIGPDTVNTMPMATIDAWRDHGVVHPKAIEEGVPEARRVIKDLAGYGIDLSYATWQVMEEGVTKFNQPFDKLLASISQKRLAWAGFGDSQTESLGKATKKLEGVAAALSEAQFLLRLWRKDSSVWTTDPAVAKLIDNRLGWLEVPATMQGKAASEIVAFAGDVKKAGFKHVVLLGMGGSSLCPEVCARTFGSRPGFPEMVVLDTTSPDAIRSAVARIDLQNSIFISASKSGSTIETNSLTSFFWQKLEAAGVKNVGAHFVAITDPGTSLAKDSARMRYRKTFINPPDIGGRFSALSYFGLVPMALIGVDIKTMLERAVAFSRDGRALVPVMQEPAARLGVALGMLGKDGRDKVTFVASRGVESLGIWIEQLIAESTGKLGVGLVPVDGEKIGKPEVYGNDRVFVSIKLAGEPADDMRLAALENAGHPVIRIKLKEALDLGAEFIRWEIAIAAAGAVLGINPFDEPNVSESKKNTANLLAEFQKKGSLPLPKENTREGAITVTLSKSAQKAIGSAGRSPRGIVQALAKSASAGDYIALLAFVQQNASHTTRLDAIRSKLRDSTRKATTAGFGPRYLHSTGQLHKGGPNKGVYFLFSCDPKGDVKIPGQDYSFGILNQAQALGDFRSLDAHGRRAVLIHLGTDVEGGLKKIAAYFGVKR